MSKIFWNNDKEYKCPSCGGNLKCFTSILTEDMQQQTVSCQNKDCGKIYDLNYRLVLDTFTEYNEK